MIYLLFEESPGEIAYARAISYVISAVYIYIFLKRRKEREGLNFTRDNTSQDVLIPFR